MSGRGRSVWTALVGVLLTGLVATGIPAAAAERTLTQADAAASSSDWVFSGSGWGHGAGMSQYGAMEMAKDGRTAAQILAHYYTGTTYDLVDDTAVISVNLQQNVAASTMRGSGLVAGGGAVTVTGDGTTMSIPAGATFHATAPAGASTVTVTCSTCTRTTVTASNISVTWNNTNTLLEVGDRRYKDGSVLLTRSSSGNTLNVVARVRVHDQYLDYIAEMPWSWPQEALRAQAAAARGYALSALSGGLRADCACHVYSTVQSQVFAGYPTSGLAQWPNWQRAVRAAGHPARGYVVRHNNRIIRALYFSSSGGRTQNGEDVWGGPSTPYLRSVPDPWSLRASNPRASWSTRISAATVASAFGLPNVTRLDLSDRGASGAVRRATATASNGATKTMTGQDFRMAVGLNSTYLARQSGRHGGADRYATSAAVAASLPASASVVIANGDSRSPVDATVGGPLAGVLNAPILLTRAGQLPSSVTRELDRRAGTLKTAYILGGTGVVTPAVESALRQRGLNVVRLGGPNRYVTAQLVAAEVNRHRAVSGVVLAESAAMADVVSASGPAAALGYPILLTPAGSVHPVTAQSLRHLRPSTAFIAGGLISEAVAGQVGAGGAAPVRLSGRDRYATAAAIATHFASRLPVSQVVISSGMDDNLVDALSAGAIKQPILFVQPTAVPSVTREALQRMPGAGRVVAAGGPGAVSGPVLENLRRV